MNTIGSRIKYLRKINNLTVDQLAVLIGLKKGSISSYENNRYEPSAKTVVSICQQFNVSSDWLLMGKGNLTPCSSQSAEGIIPKNSVSNSMDLTEFEKNLLHYLRLLPNDEKEEVDEIIMMKYKRYLKKHQLSDSNHK
ncbi:MAG: helix-turn-helix domain-containing protein [Clostridia bacterium]|nr:helix-turn-helix domain-containing protein [Clostridia bacterium]